MNTRSGFGLLAALVLLSGGRAHAQVPDRGAPLPRRTFLGAALAPDAGGVKIVRIAPGGTAEAAGLAVGDVVLAVNGGSVDAPEALGRALRPLAGGASVAFRVRRDGKDLDLKGPAKERPRQKGDGEVVAYEQVVSRGHRIRIIATHPKGAGPFPAVMLIGGIGAYSVDGEWATAPYGTILGPISKAGYATIRVEKPGQGDSEGPEYPDLAFDDELDAYLQALRLAKTLPYVAKERIALFGHSMGGAFGPLLARQEPVAGIAVHGTIAKTWFEYQIENARRQALLAGASPSEVDAQIRVVGTAAHDLFTEGLTPEQIAAKGPEARAALATLTTDGRTVSGVGIPFFQALAKRNLVEAWEALASEPKGARVLALWGENDFVSTRWDHEFIARIVNAKRPGGAEFVALPASDHGFYRTNSTEDSFAKWGRPGAEFNPNVVETLLPWLARTLG